MSRARRLYEPRPVEVADDMLDEELRYLRAEIYRWPDADPPIRRLTALERFKA